MKSILVTGATGFLGKHLVEQLKASEGEARIRVLCRRGSPWENDAQVETVHGDITSSGDVRRAAAGATEIYHLAGVVSRDPRAAPLLYRTHIEGTRQVCEAAHRHEVGRIVLVSSSGTIAVGPEPVAYDENSGYKHEIVGEWPYYLSKIFAEKLALSYLAQYKLPVVIVNPSLLLGPGDDRSSSTHDVELFLGGQILAIPLGGLNFVDARDAARGLMAAMRSGSPGERYLLGGPNWTFREFIQHLSEVSSVRAPKMQPSLGTQLASARLLRRLMPLVGKSFPLDDVSIKMSALFWYCDTRKARAELGFTTRDPLETLKDTVADLRQRGVA